MKPQAYIAGNPSDGYRGNVSSREMDVPLHWCPDLADAFREVFSLAASNPSLFRHGVDVSVHTTGTRRRSHGL